MFNIFKRWKQKRKHKLVETWNYTPIQFTSKTTNIVTVTACHTLDHVENQEFKLGNLYVKGQLNNSLENMIGRQILKDGLADIHYIQNVDGTMTVKALVNVVAR